MQYWVDYWILQQKVRLSLFLVSHEPDTLFSQGDTSWYGWLRGNPWQLSPTKVPQGRNLLLFPRPTFLKLLHFFAFQSFHQIFGDFPPSRDSILTSLPYKIFYASKRSSNWSSLISPSWELPCHGSIVFFLSSFTENLEVGLHLGPALWIFSDLFCSPQFYHTKLTSSYLIVKSDLCPPLVLFVAVVSISCIVLLESLELHDYIHTCIHTHMH